MLATSSGSALYSFHNKKNIHFQKGREEGGLGKDERGNQIYYMEKIYCQKIFKGLHLPPRSEKKRYFYFKKEMECKH